MYNVFYAGAQLGLDPQSNRLTGITYHKGYNINMHMHDFTEINIVMSGEGIHYIENNQYSIKRGDVFVIPTMIKHAFCGTDMLNVFHILIHDKFFLDYEKVLRTLPMYTIMFHIEPHMRAYADAHCFCRLQQECIQEIELLVDMLQNINISTYQEKNTSLNAAVAYVITRLAYYYRLFHKDSLSKIVDQHYIMFMKTVDYMHQNFDTNISCDTLAQMMHVSRTSYFKLFKKYMNCTPGNYINLYRVEKAQALLIYSDMTITDISYACGFYDCSHFIRVFSRTIGQTPIQYREANRTE